MNAEPKRISRRTLLRLGAAGLVASTGIGIYASSMQVTRRPLALPNWRSDGFRVVQLSDVHLINDRQLEALHEAVAIARAERPDVLVVTGDFLNYNQEHAFRRIERAFAGLDGIGCPCLAVLGNHDYRCGVPGKVVESLSKTPLTLLVNEKVNVQGVSVVGLDDALEGKPNYDLASDGDLVLLHEPDYVDQLPAKAGLVLSGHSHGGEVCLPGGIPIYTPTGSRSYKSGFYPDAPSPVYVNRGTATLAFARVFCPPEVAVLTLVRG